MERGDAPNLIFTGSPSELQTGLAAMAQFQARSLAGAASRGSRRLEADTRSKSTKGNARFGLERTRALCYPQCNVHIILVTSDFHMERSRMIFQRAADVFLRAFGHKVLITVAPSDTPAGEAGDHYRAKAPALEQQLRAALTKGVADEQVYKWI